MGERGSKRIMEIFEKISVLEQKGDDSMSLMEVADEIDAPLDSRDILNLLERMNMLEINNEGQEVMLTDFAKDVMELPQT